MIETTITAVMKQHILIRELSGDNNRPVSGSRAKASFYGRLIISMILIISIFQSLAASARTAGAQKARTVGVHLLCSPLYSSINI